MLYNADASLEEETNNSPVLDTVVNISSCYYYLSLLERFANTIKDMTETELKYYLVRAESRYSKWIFHKSFKMLLPRKTPPLDVAFFWHAHMLSPLRYYEDMKKNFNSDRRNISLPLKEIYHSRHEPTKESLKQWHKLMGRGEPFNLENNREHLFSSYASITCIVCSNSVSVTWEDYADWRTDERVAIRCHCCDTEFTAKHCGKANLFQDISFSGLPKDNNITKFLLNCCELGKQNFDAGPDRIEEFLARFQDRLGSPSTSEKPTRSREEFMASIKSTYLCTPYRSSIDMLMAVSRLLGFTTKVTSQIDWKSSDEIARSIQRYREFLHITQCSPTLIPVPTIDVDLVWHTHMLHPKNYRQFSIKHLKRVINHDDNIPLEDIDKRIRQFIFAKRHYRQGSVEDKASIHSNSKKSRFGITIRSRSNSSTSLIFPDKTFGGVYSGDIEISNVENETFDEIMNGINIYSIQKFRRGSTKTVRL
ncbi:hypothetical protein BDF21DRAFT_455466, partial [Thamnidium elegans]